MLKRPGKPAKVRERNRHRWALVLVMPPLILLVWLGVGADLAWGSSEELHRLTTQWRFNDPIQREWIRRWQGSYGREGKINVGWGFQIGRRQASFMLDYRRQLQTLPRSPGNPGSSLVSIIGRTGSSSEVSEVVSGQHSEGEGVEVGESPH